jgi:hypothetical protein
MKKALDIIGEGRIYPMLYNDDVNIPSVRKAFGIFQKKKLSNTFLMVAASMP